MLALESFFGLTTTDVRKMAYKLAEKIKIKHSFDKKNGISGKGWLRGFCQRNPQLSLHLARAEAFNKPLINKFFTKMERVVEEYKIDNTMKGK